MIHLGFVHHTFSSLWTSKANYRGWQWCSTVLLSFAPHLQSSLIDNLPLINVGCEPVANGHTHTHTHTTNPNGEESGDDNNLVRHSGHVNYGGLMLLDTWILDLQQTLPNETKRNETNERTLSTVIGGGRLASSLLSILDFGLATSCLFTARTHIRLD